LTKIAPSPAKTKVLDDVENFNGLVKAAVFWLLGYY